MKTTMLAMMMAVGLVGCDGGATSNPMPGVAMTQSIDQEGLTQVEIGFRNPAAKHTVFALMVGDVVAQRVIFAPGEQKHTVTLAIDGEAQLALKYEADAIVRPSSVPTPDPAGPEGRF
jgi:hypothetical protein